MKSYAIEMLGISKLFGSLIANNNIDLRVERNTIHGIIGENGAGKSTLMSVLFGLYKPDSGVIKINGSEVWIKSPHDAAKLRIGMVHQHFKLVAAYNAIDNIILGNEIHNFGFLNRRKAKAKIEELSKKYNFDVNLSIPVGKLSVGQQQKIEILKTLFLNSEILIFDEPTAVLTPQEVTSFLNLLKQFKSEGKTVILISHKLEEIRTVCSEATVIRHGHVVGTVSVLDTTTQHLAKMMVGSDVVEVKNTSHKKSGKVILELEKVNAKKLKNVSLKIFEGEIVAIAGVEGNGQSELVRVVTGLEHIKSGKLFYHLRDNKLVAMPFKSLFKKGSSKTDYQNYWKALQNKALFWKKPSFIAEQKLDIALFPIKTRNNIGIAHVPEDRHKHGLVLDMKVKYNISIKRMKEFSFLGIIRENKVRVFTRNVITKYDVRGAAYGESYARQLSGGNQQKAVLGREIESKHNLLVVAQPTRGLDIGAIRNVHEQILLEKSLGRGVLLVSFELSEVMSLADRIIVMNKNEIVGEISARGAKREDIGLMMAGIIPNGKVLPAKPVEEVIETSKVKKFLRKRPHANR